MPEGGPSSRVLKRKGEERVKGDTTKSFSCWEGGESERQPARERGVGEVGKRKGVLLPLAREENSCTNQKKKGMGLNRSHWQKNRANRRK